ncbi:hypothetical protein VNO78_15538 [Psophocarpus tetragonolobus]|uniref:Pulmonary surfactant-associated protein B n=1 Tax=Psophocarpus tetragonolobus TaxID=3891 RepID=A0AAN9SK90_PSOTE
MQLQSEDSNQPFHVTQKKNNQPFRAATNLTPITTILFPFPYILLHITSFHTKSCYYINFYHLCWMTSWFSQILFFSGSMEGRMGLLFLVVLGSAWACDARELANSETEVSIKPDVCALCEEYITKAVDYMHENKTQQEIIDILHNTCHQLPTFKQKCTALVDYYVPLFFLEVATIQPGEFCHKVNLCQHIADISMQVQEDSCEFCKDTVSTLLDKLKESDTKLEIIETLLKVCNSVEKYANKCKKIVFEYAPLVFDNAEKILEKTDICTVIHACKSSTVTGQQAFLSES